MMCEAAAMPLTVFTARMIRTMDPSLPTANAIAVRDGRIVEVGTIESLQPWLRHHEHVIDDRFADSVLLPGFIDPHVHPAMMSLLLAAHWITPEPWDLPGRDIPATEGRDAYLARLSELIAADGSGAEGDAASEPFVTYGYHAQFHGEISRSDLDAITTDRPLIVWQRSFHELWVNTPALAWLDAEEGAAWDPHVDLAAGRLFESGMVWGLRTLGPYLLGDGKLDRGLDDCATLVRAGGVTTIADAGYGIFDFDMELASFREHFGSDESPFRLYLMPNVLSAKGKLKGGGDLFDQLDAFRSYETERMQFLHAAKFLADGAFIAQLMQMGPPGYIDGHEGAWLSDPEQLYLLIKPFWDANFDINIHANGDQGVTACLDTIDRLLRETPRFDHRTTLHHFGVSTQAQVRRLAALGVAVQANGYYLHLFGDAFVDRWLGTERASQMTRLGSVAREGASVAVHSDLPMGPVAPLLAASAIATRATRNGTTMAPTEALSVEDALRAITIEAAWQLRLDHEVGSLAAGKLADLVVLADDPFTTDPIDWPAIEIEATVVGGRVYP